MTVPEKRLLNDPSEETFDPNNFYNEENIFLSRDSNLNGHHHLTTPAFLKHTFVFIAVIVVSFLVLMFLVAIVIVSRFSMKFCWLEILKRINFLFDI